MVAIPTYLVEPEIMAQLFSAFRLFERIESGELSTLVRKEEPAREPGWKKQILKHFDARGVHLCTTHRIIDDAGFTRHWDGACIYMGDFSVAKQSREWIAKQERLRSRPKPPP